MKIRIVSASAPTWTDFSADKVCDVRYHVEGHVGYSEVSIPASTVMQGVSAVVKAIGAHEHEKNKRSAENDKLQQVMGRLLGQEFDV